MSYMDDLVDLNNYIDFINSCISQGNNPITNSNAFVLLSKKTVNILTGVLSVVSDVVVDGHPYPPYSLQVVHNAADHVDLEWVAGRGNVDGHDVYRSDDGGSTWNNLTPAHLAYDATTYTDSTVAAGTSYEYKVVAFNYVANPLGCVFVWGASETLALAFPANIVTSITDSFCFAAPRNGRIKNAALYLEDTGADASDPLEIQADVKINTFTVFSTKPKITKDAADKSSTLIAGTGITQPAIDDSQNTFALGDRISIDLALTRTTPEAEMAGAVVEIEVDLGNPSDSGPSNILGVTTPAS